MSFAIKADNISRSFKVKKKIISALKSINIDAKQGEITMLVGPDGAGKTTFLRMCAGLLTPDAGTLEILGLNAVKTPYLIQSQVSYMPQRFGLYEDLTVAENLDLYADLYGISGDDRQKRAKELLKMTDLTRFQQRLAGKLSGGMKQKLGLACTMLSKPKLLILDEPCVGVDPLSRADLWSIITRMVKQDKLTVLVSTAYLDETEYAEKVYVFNEGELLIGCSPTELKAKASNRTFAVTPLADDLPRILQASLLENTTNVCDAVPLSGKINITLAPGVNLQNLAIEHQVATREPSAEDGFMATFRERSGEGIHLSGSVPKIKAQLNSETIIEVSDLLKLFGDFVAVNHTSFTVNKGEIFGLLGPNGAGKTTTFRMLCGLIPASSGVLKVAGYNLRTAREQARARIGYVAQKFSLYSDLSVLDNLNFFGGVYGLRGKALKTRISEVAEEFELTEHLNFKAGDLPGGFKQRLSMATGTIHKPDILFLDEPTSGTDPIARRVFWYLITSLAANGTTIIITTHFLEEAEYCNRIMIQDAGTMIALGTPLDVRRQGGETENKPLSMEQVFINIVMKSRESKNE
jgi:ABC-2 type transport system ATP-binding protein